MLLHFALLEALVLKNIFFHTFIYKSRVNHEIRVGWHLIDYISKNGCASRLTFTCEICMVNLILPNHLTIEKMVI
jgi:hypothetical protein